LTPPRFSGRFTPEVVAVAAKYCDVMSFNVYEYLPEMRKVDELAQEHDFPVISVSSTSAHWIAA